MVVQLRGERDCEVPSPQPPPARGGGALHLYLLPLPLREGVGGRGSGAAISPADPAAASNDPTARQASHHASTAPHPRAPPAQATGTHDRYGSRCRGGCTPSTRAPPDSDAATDRETPRHPRGP